MAQIFENIDINVIAFWKEHLMYHFQKTALGCLPHYDKVKL
jgi:hypothetical protein